MPKKRVIQTSFSFDTPASPRHRAKARRGNKATPGRSVSKKQEEETLQGRLPVEGVPGEEAQRLMQKRVAAHMSGTLELVITDNRYSIITVKRKGSHYRLRIHHMFLNADAQVLRALARYMEKNDDEASQILNEFIDRNGDKIKAPPPRPSRKPKIRTKGKIYDLQRLFDDLNQRLFGGALRIDITWGRSPKGRPKRHRSIKMGSYSVEDKLIRIHPALDRAFVPKYFIESVIFHEILHHVHPIPVKGGRRQFHTPEFKAQEKTFPQYQKAQKWERANIDRLLFY